jgi:hypothetical protein
MSNTLGLYSSLNVRNQTHTKQKNDSPVLCVLVFWDLDIERLAEGALQNNFLLTFHARNFVFYCRRQLLVF